MFQVLIEPSLEAVMICSEFGVKHNQVTALWIDKSMRNEQYAYLAITRA